MTTWTSPVGGNCPSMRRRYFNIPRVDAGDDSVRSPVRSPRPAPQRGTWRHSDCSRGSAAPDARSRRQQRAGAIQGSLDSFIHAQHQRAIRRFRYKPTMSRTLSTNCGSADSLTVSRRCDCKPTAPDARDGRLRHTRDFPHRARVQCVAWGGGASNVRVMMSTTMSSLTLRATPGRRSSARPSKRLTRKRSRHFPTPSSDTCT